MNTWNGKKLAYFHQSKVMKKACLLIYFLSKQINERQTKWLPTDEEEGTYMERNSVSIHYLDLGTLEILYKVINPKTAIPEHWNR